MPSPSFPLLRIPLLAGMLALAGCDAPPPKPEAGPGGSAAEKRTDFTHPKELVEGEDGLFRRRGENDPYTGAVTIRDRDWNLRHFAYYQNGKLHGPELKFWEDGTLRRNFDYENGEKVRHREWFENGNPKTDAMFVGGEAIGPHRTWFEDGSPRWSGTFVEGLLWDGRIVDYAPGGKLMWDAIFERGRYVSGVYPESEQEKLIEGGMLKPEDAVFPRNPAAGKPGGEDEAAAPAQPEAN